MSLRYFSFLLNIRSPDYRLWSATFFLLGAEELDAWAEELDAWAGELDAWAEELDNTWFCTEKLEAWLCWEKKLEELVTWSCPDIIKFVIF